MDFSDKDKLKDQIEDTTMLAHRWEFEANFLEQREVEIQNKLMEFQSKTFDKIQTYNNFVITMGYAGFFAIWSFVDENLPSFDRNLIALLLGLSLLVFIYWTLQQSMKLTRVSSAASKVLGKEYDHRHEFLEAWNEYELNLARSVSKAQRFYPYVFAASAGTGFTAGLMLIVLLSSQILGFSFSFQNLFHFLTWFAR